MKTLNTRYRKARVRLFISSKIKEIAAEPDDRERHVAIRQLQHSMVKLMTAPITAKNPDLCADYSPVTVVRRAKTTYSGSAFNILTIARSVRANRPSGSRDVARFIVVREGEEVPFMPTLHSTLRHAKLDVAGEILYEEVEKERGLTEDHPMESDIRTTYRKPQEW